MSSPSHQLGYETKDVDVSFLTTILFFLAIMLVAIFFLIGGLMRYYRLNEPAETAGHANLPVAGTVTFPQPRLEVTPGADMATLRAAEDRDLNSYGWVDRSKERVRLPIDRAMQLILQRGLPDVGAGQSPLSLMQARPNESATPLALRPQ